MPKKPPAEVQAYLSKPADNRPRTRWAERPDRPTPGGRRLQLCSNDRGRRRVLGDNSFGHLGDPTLGVAVPA
jgi:hypothetical protein